MFSLLSNVVLLVFILINKYGYAVGADGVGLVDGADQTISIALYPSYKNVESQRVSWTHAGSVLSHAFGSQKLNDMLDAKGFFDQDNKDNKDKTENLKDHYKFIHNSIYSKTNKLPKRQTDLPFLLIFSPLLSQEYFKSDDLKGASFVVDTTDVFNLSSNKYARSSANGLNSDLQQYISDNMNNDNNMKEMKETNQNDKSFDITKLFMDICPDENTIESIQNKDLDLPVDYFKNFIENKDLDLFDINKDSQLAKELYLLSNIKFNSKKDLRKSIYLSSILNYQNDNQRLNIVSNMLQNSINKLIKSFRSSLDINTTPVISIISINENNLTESSLSSKLNIKSELNIKNISSSSSSSCYESEDECISSTSSCTNHGKCVEYKSYTGETCFKCQCLKTYVDDNGKSNPNYKGTYDWTGDSCQYRDISVPFQLFFWFVVIFALILTASINLLASSGDSAPKGVGARMVVRSKME